MTRDHEHDTFTRSELFREDGHATDLALSAVADEQLELLSASLTRHVDDCPVCQLRLADLALLAFSLGSELASLQAAASTQRQELQSPSAIPGRLPFPKAAGTLAAALALLGVLPTLTEFPALPIRLVASLSFVPSILSALWRSLLAANAHGGFALHLLTFSSACGLAALVWILSPKRSFPGDFA